MSRSVVAMLFFVLVSQAAAADLEQFPVEFTVAAAGAVVRCGPGNDHYGTAELTSGTHVEVYRRDGEWLGIRPPEGSFCWVRSDQASMTANTRVAKVVTNDVVAWIGSGLEDVSEHRWQVRLKPGELMEVLGQGQFTPFAVREKERCYRVSPPAGEYRWVHERDVRPVDQPFPTDSHVETTSYREDSIQPAEHSEPPSFFVPSEPVSKRQSSPGWQSASRADRGARRDERPLAENSFDDQLRNLDLSLALAVSNSPGSWELSGLRAEAELLAKTASTTLQRARSQVVLKRLSEYHSLQRRYAGLGDKLSLASSRSDIRPVAAREEIEPVDPEVAARPAVDPRFDGTGWLLPVHSTKRASPPYALLDADGQIRQFVSPAPGINLHRYLRKEVGVFGQRDSSTTLSKPHLTAHRIIDLSRHR